MPVSALTWNTHIGRGTPAALMLARERRVDVLLLQEATEPQEWAGSRVGAFVPGQPWGSWVLVADGDLSPIPSSGYDGWVAGARWSRRDSAEDSFLFSLHSPTATEAEPRQDYVTEARAIVAAICEAVPAEASLLIGGDFNFLSLGTRLPAEPLQNTVAEKAALRDFEQRGFSAAWRACHADAPLPQTLRWKRNAAMPYHCDGFLVRGLGVLECEALAGSAIERASDHNPVQITVEGRSARPPQ